MIWFLIMAPAGLFYMRGLYCVLFDKHSLFGPAATLVRVIRARLQMRGDIIDRLK
jgi:hypothetical protein